MQTDTKKPASVKKSDPAARRRRLRRVAVTLGIVMAVLLVVALLLPVWASTAQGRGYVLDQINRDLRGKLSVQSWRLGWFSGMEADGVTLMDASGQPILQCAHLKTELTLLSILRGNYDFGDTIIVKPELFLRRYADGTSNVNRVFAEAAGGPNRTRANWEKMIGQLRGALKVEDGTLVMSAEGTKEIICVTQIQGDIPVASPNSPVHLSVVGTAVHEQDRRPVSMEVGVPSLLAWSANPLIVLQDIDISAAAIPVGPLAAWTGLSPGWEESFGTTLEVFKLENHVPRGIEWSLPRLEARGARGRLSLSLLMQTTPGKIVVSLLNTPDYWAHLQCAPSAPADAMLAYCNPFVAGATGGAGVIDVTLSDLEVPLGTPEAARAAGILSITGAREKVPGQLRGLGLTLPVAGGEVEMNVPAVRFSVAAERLSYERMDLQFPAAAVLTFSGSTGLTDGTVKLLMSGSTGGPGLSSGMLRVVIGGTAANPQVAKPGGGSP